VSQGRRSWAVALVLSLAETLAAGWLASGIQLRSALVDLLPRERPAADEYRQFVEKFGGFERIYVLVTAADGIAADPELLTEAAALLAERVEAFDEISHARSGINERDEAFFLDYVLPRAPLLTNPEQVPNMLERLEPEAIRERVRMMRGKLAGPLGAFEQSLLSTDPLGLAEFIDGPSAGESVPMDPESGAFLSSTGDTALVVATPSVPTLDSARGRELAAHLSTAYAEVRAESGADLEFLALGGPLYAAQDEKIIRGDLVRTVAASAILIGLLLVAFFRGPLVPAALILSVSAGVIWTLAAMVVLRGGISVISISFAAILIGLGVDYGIHGATRFRQALHSGADRHGAMLLAFRQTGRAIVVSVLTTASAFAVLTLARFEPVRELGQLVMMGIVAILIASLGVGASLLVLVGRGRSGQHHERTRSDSGLWDVLNRSVGALVDLAGRHSRTVVAIAVVLTLAATFGIPRLVFSASLQSLRPEDHPASTAERLLVERFGLGLDTTTIVVHGEDVAKVVETARRVERAVGEDLEPGDEIVSPSRWFASGRERSAALTGESLRSAATVLESELGAAGFNPSAFARSLDVLRSLGRGESLPEIPQDSWPSWLAELVHVDDDGAALAINVRTQSGRWPDGPPAETLAAIHSIDPVAAVASVPRVAREMRATVSEDLSRLSGWCALMVGAVVLISFRGRLGAFVQSMIPVLAGTYWLLGFCGIFGIPIDLLSLTVAPLLIGIGIDDGLHAIHGVRHHGSLAASVRHIGPAVALTTLTTAIGFGSLLFSRIPALRGGGLLVALGTLLCLGTTLLLLPALATLRKTSTVK
jgi:predicted RND superfamily exporter protein